MGSVQVLDPEGELGRFFDYIYGDEEGFVYSPTKDPETGNFEQYFFHWPTEREALLSHVHTLSATKEVYYGPGLFSEPNANKESFRGTHFVWAEFDGAVPKGTENIPEPSMRLQSSVPGHEHWYWRIDRFCTDQSIVEDISQRLTYHLEADLACWNSNRVLRPPRTIHHESGNPVSILSWDKNRATPVGQFTELPQLPIKFLQDTDINYIPPVLDVIMKYSWPSEHATFFQEKNIEKGHRSSALTKLCHICMELGMTNAETLSLLLNADSRWGKFSKRKDQRQRLLGIINYCRARHPVGEDGKEIPKESRLRVFSFDEFMESKTNLEWLIPNLLHKKGILSISGPPGIGKSQLSLRFAEKMALGEDFLKWHIPRPCRTLFVSMEMPHEELKYFLLSMKIPLGNKLLQDNFKIMPLGSSIRLNNKSAQLELAKVIEEYEPEGVIFDSLGKGVGDDINSEKIIFETFDYVDRIIRQRYGAFAWFVHHPRKGQIGNKKPNKLEDLFGSQYIGAYVSTAMSLWQSGLDIEVNCLKLRMAEQFKPFKIRRTPSIDFRLVEGLTISRDKPIFGDSNAEEASGLSLGDTI